MVLSDEEKKVFNVNDEEDFNPYSIEDYLFTIYNTDLNEENLFDVKITLNFIRKMIIEFAQNNGYDIKGNESYNIDDLLNEIVEVPSESDNKILSSFNPLLYKNAEEFNNYFSLITSDLSWEDLQYTTKSFGWVNDSFRSFFVDYLRPLVHVAPKLYYKLKESEKGDSVFENSIVSDDSPVDWGEEDEEVTTNVIDTSEDIEAPTDFIDTSEDEFYVWDDNDSWLNEFTNTSTDNSSDTNELDEAKLLDYLKFINIVEELIKYRIMGVNKIRDLYELTRKKKLEDFYSNEEFSSNFDLIMNHNTDESIYYFHGTQCLEDAQSIIDEGLGMMQPYLSSTAYMEFTKDEVLLYERGFGGEIGHDAIVIIDVPKNNNGEEINVVTQLQEPDSIHFSPSGLQGLDGKPKFIVLPENIVGYVDKRNKTIVFNPKYKNYESITINIKKR